MGSFEKSTGRLTYSQALESELAELVDARTGRLSSRYSKTINCPLCNERPRVHRHLFEKRGYSFVRCSNCSLIFANPQVKESVVSAGFNNRTFELWSSILENPAQQALDGEKHRGILKLLSKYGRKGKLLDIGYNGGHFALTARELGWDASAVELCPHTYKLAGERLQNKVTLQRLGNLPRFKDRFEAITMLEVLEHFPQPLTFLEKLRPLIRKKGLLFLLLPNAESLAARVLRERAALFDGRYQLIFFSPATIAFALKQAGFKTVFCDTIYTSLQPVGRFLSWQDPYAADDLDLDAALSSWGLKRPSVEKWILKNNLGYKLRVVAEAR